MSAAEPTPKRGTLYCPTCEGEFRGVSLCPDDGTRLVRLAPDEDPFVGRVLDERFTIEQKLGEGGMGAVYRARQHSVGRSVAIKVVTPGLVTDSLATKRFLREAKLVSQLSHPNIVSVLDFGQTPDGLFYLVMELVQGRTLHEALTSEKRMSVERVVRIGQQICDALEYAHAIPLMHRDLKPANVMLLAGKREHVKVLDFGLAKSLSPDKGGSAMTSTGALLGTPQFMPPEVAMGESVDERGDLYSLGCILFMLSAGRPPFVSDAIAEVIAMHGTQQAPRLKGVPRAFADVVDRLLRKDPTTRYASAAATHAALEAVLKAPSEDAYAETVDEPLTEVNSSLVRSRETVASLHGAPNSGMPLPPAPSVDGAIKHVYAETPLRGIDKVHASPRRPGLIVGLALAIVLVVGTAIYVATNDRTPTKPSTTVQPVTLPATELDATVLAPPDAPATVEPTATPDATEMVADAPAVVPVDARRRENRTLVPADAAVRVPVDAYEPPPF